MQRPRRNRSAWGLIAVAAWGLGGTDSARAQAAGPRPPSAGATTPSGPAAPMAPGVAPAAPGTLAAPGTSAAPPGTPGAAPAQPAAGSANDAILQQWNRQGGQAASVVQTDQGTQIEWHGTVTLDEHKVDVSSPGSPPGNNPALTPLRAGTYFQGMFAGDLRSTNPTGDVSYIQGVLNATHDRSILTRYNHMLSGFQFGRAGPGYQVAGGDLMTSYSGLGANVGLRGASVVRQFDAATLSGFGGVVAESWESLANQTPVDGRPARPTYLRDVNGVKAEYQLSPQWTVLTTWQSFRDRPGSTEAPAGFVLPEGRAAHSATLGTRYQNMSPDGSSLMGTVEWGASRSHSVTAPTPDEAADNAFVADLQARMGTVGLRGGFHDLGPRWASVGQAAMPGVREWYAGGDWQFTAGWQWALDLRDTLTRQYLAGVVSRNQLESVTQRLSWTPLSLPGWSFTLQDLRNRNTDTQGAHGRNNGWQFLVAWAQQPWNANLMFGRTRQTFEANPLGDSTTDQWQLAVGRLWSDATEQTPPTTTFNLMLMLGVQDQELATPARNTSRTAGLTAALASTRWGNLNASYQAQEIDPHGASPLLRTRQWLMDYTLALTNSWTIKGYARWAHRNAGNPTAEVTERVLGLQAGYRW